MNFVFDLDGTLALIDHRTHYVRDGARDWDSFFEACDKDLPNIPVIKALQAHFDMGHNVEIWSGRSDAVMLKTAIWLDQHIGTLYTPTLDMVAARDLIGNMRSSTDYRSDVTIKREWLNEARANGCAPDVVYDDRQCVVDMWREEGVTCFQVAPGDFDTNAPAAPKRPRKPLLSVLIGPSGAGKSSWLKDQGFPRSSIVSTDTIRSIQFGGVNYAKRAYTPEGFHTTFTAAHAITKARLDAGLDVQFDATNLRAGDRKKLLAAVGADTGEVNVNYVIIDRPLDEKLKSYDPSSTTTNPEIITKHHMTFQSSKKHALAGDDLPFVSVFEYIS